AVHGKTAASFVQSDYSNRPQTDRTFALPIMLRRERMRVMLQSDQYSRRTISSKLQTLIANPCFHCRSDAQRLMNPPKVVIHEIKRSRPVSSASGLPVHVAASQSLHSRLRSE